MTVVGQWNLATTAEKLWSEGWDNHISCLCAFAHVLPFRNASLLPTPISAYWLWKPTQMALFSMKGSLLPPVQSASAPSSPSAPPETSLSGVWALGGNLVPAKHSNSENLRHARTTSHWLTGFFKGKNHSCPPNMHNGKSHLPLKVIVHMFHWKGLSWVLFRKMYSGGRSKAF